MLRNFDPNDGKILRGKEDGFISLSGVGLEIARLNILV